MIDFEAELAKFQPSLDVEQAEDAIYGNNTTDVTDLLQPYSFMIPAASHRPYLSARSS